MNVLETRISCFKNTRATETIKGEINTVASVLRRFKDGYWADQVLAIRNGNEELKKQVPTIAFHGTFDGFRKKDLFIEASGLIILDIDDVEDDLEEVKEEIMNDSDHVVACMISPSGNGIKVLYYVDPILVSQESYRAIGKKIVSDFDIYGSVDFLSVTDTLIVTHDPKILINYNAEPAVVFVKETVIKKSELEPLDETKDLWDDPEEFFETVLFEDIVSKTNNNFHFIQVAVLDMKKFGFTHREHDLEFIVEYGESEFGSSNKNEQRFKEVNIIAERYPQMHWPYRMGGSDEEEEEEIDYSAYIDDSVKRESGDDSEDLLEGLISYENIFDKVLDVVKRGNRVGREISLSNLADIFRFGGTGILTITGIPTHGKTELSDQCILDLARLFGEETIVCGFEQEPEEHLVKLARKLLGVDVRCKSWLNEESEKRLKKAILFITSKIKHVNAIEVGGNITAILEVCAKRIHKSRQEGGDPKYIVLDPFNMLSIKGKYSGTGEVDAILKKITHFSHKMGVLAILIAHPTKMKRDDKTKEFEIPDFYSVKGSSAFFEMSYHGLVVYRTKAGVLVRVLKVKQNNLGEKDGEANFDYNKDSGRYIPLDENYNEIDGDHRDLDWLTRALEREEE